MFPAPVPWRYHVNEPAKTGTFSVADGGSKKISQILIRNRVDVLSHVHALCFFKDYLKSNA